MIVTRPELRGNKGAIASTHWLASQAGMAVMEEGGNAFDAAAAAGFVLQVVEPHSNGLGGDVSIILYSATTGRVQVICGQGPMPKAATIQKMRSLGLAQIPGSGLLPACVPGGFGAWLRMLAEHGTARLSRIMDPAIQYAEEGFPLLAAAAQVISVLAPLFRTEWSESGRTYLSNGSAPTAGSRIRNETLANTLKQILRESQNASTSREAQIDAAHRTFYDGFIAEKIDSFVAHTEVLDSTGSRHRGLLTASDLAGWHPEVEAGTSLDYGPYTVIKPGPWSQGPVFLQQLALLAGFELSAFKLGSVDYIHTLVEVAKLALADREAWYGDPHFTEVPIADLLSAGYSDARRRLIGREAASPLPGNPGGRQSWIPEPIHTRYSSDGGEWMRQLENGIPTVTLQATIGSGDTCTVVAADRHGNLVAAVPSGGWLKSSPVIPGLGFPLGTRGQTLWLTEGHPNSLAPGKRPRTTLSPTLALYAGSPYLALGTPGGDQQDQWTLQSFLAVTQFGLDLQAAVEIGAFNSDHFPVSFAPRTARPGVVVLERPHDPSVSTELKARGHLVDEVPDFSLGKVCMAGIEAGPGGFVRAAAGPRGRQAYAACG